MNESSLSQKEQNNDDFDDTTTLKWGINNDVNDDDDDDFGVLFVTNLTIFKREQKMSLLYF